MKTTINKKERKSLFERNSFDLRYMSLWQKIILTLFVVFVTLSVILSFALFFPVRKDEKIYDYHLDLRRIYDSVEISYKDGTFKKIDTPVVKDALFFSDKEVKGGVTIRFLVPDSTSNDDAIFFVKEDLKLNPFIDLNDNGVKDNNEDTKNSFEINPRFNPVHDENYIYLNESYRGHYLYINLVFDNLSFFSSIGELSYGKASSIYHTRFVSSIYDFNFGFFIMAVSLIVIILLFLDKNGKTTNLILIAFFGFITGLYGVVESGFLQQTSNYGFIWNFWQTALILISSWVVVILVYSFAPTRKIQRMSKFFAMFILTLLFSLILFVVINVISMTIIYYFGLFIYLVAIIFAYITSIKSLKTSTEGRKDLTLVFSFGILLIAAIFEAIFLYLNKSKYICLANLAGAITCLLICTLGRFKLYIINTNDRILEEKYMQDSKVAIMLAQIQPHFLYNSLNSIAILCDINPKQARDLTLKFALYLRNNISALSQEAPIHFKTELKNIRNYLEIEKIRFQEKLNIVENIKTMDFYVPVLTIQPIVENAVKHGVSKRSTPGVVMISTDEDLNNFYVIIEDNGVGFDTKALETAEKLGTSIGISNVRYRLKSTMGADILIESEVGKGTKVRIKFPKVTNELKGIK